MFSLCNSTLIENPLLLIVGLRKCLMLVGWFARQGLFFFNNGRGSLPPVAPQDEAGLTKTFQTWPRGWFHIP